MLRLLLERAHASGWHYLIVQPLRQWYEPGIEVYNSSAGSDREARGKVTPIPELIPEIDSS